MVFFGGEGRVVKGSEEVLTIRAARSVSDAWDEARKVYWMGGSERSGGGFRAR